MNSLLPYFGSSFGRGGIFQNINPSDPFPDDVPRPFGEDEDLDDDYDDETDHEDDDDGEDEDDYEDFLIFGQIVERIINDFENILHLHQILKTIIHMAYPNHPPTPFYYNHVQDLDNSMTVLRLVASLEDEDGDYPFDSNGSFEKVYQSARGEYKKAFNSLSNHPSTPSIPYLKDLPEYPIRSFGGSAS